MDVYARWVYGKHPADEMIQGYILKGAMNYGEKDGSILSAAVVTLQAEDYYDSAWSVPLEDYEVSVVHLLCVGARMTGERACPQYHGLDEFFPI